MIMPMMERFGNQIFIMYLKVIRSWLVLAFFQRLALLFIHGQSITYYQNLPLSTKITIFFQGMRFDLLVMGFFLLPVVLILELSSILGVWSKIERQWGKYWMAGCWTLWSVLSYLGGLEYVRSGRFWTIYDLQERHFPIFFSNTDIWLFTFVMVGIWITGLMATAQVEVPEFLDGVKKEILLIPILVTALFARGTVTPHHLRREDSIITSYAPLNELVLNPAWVFDKYPYASP